MAWGNGFHAPAGSGYGNTFPSCPLPVPNECTVHNILDPLRVRSGSNILPHTLLEIHRHADDSSCASCVISCSLIVCIVQQIVALEIGAYPWSELIGDLQIQVIP